MTLKPNATESWLFEKVTKIDKRLARLTKEKKRKDTNKIRNERGQITPDTAGIQRIIHEDRDKVHNTKFRNREEMDQY